MIKVDEKLCTQCGICVKNCPITIISQTIEDKYPYIEEHNKRRCVSCGHCEAICPHGALKHQSPETYSEPMENGIVELKPEEVSLYFRNRRSIRNYKQKEVNKATIEKVLDVVRYAPTGINSQTVKWIIVYDKNSVVKLSELTIDFMRLVLQTNREMAIKYGFVNYIKMVENGIPAEQIVCRKSPHLAISYIEANNTIGINDSIIASSHFELILPAYGLGGCWAGYLNLAFQTMKEMKTLIGLDDNYVVKSALMFGYPQYKYQKVPARKAIDVKWI